MKPSVRAQLNLSIKEELLSSFMLALHKQNERLLAEKKKPVTKTKIIEQFIERYIQQCTE